LQRGLLALQHGDLAQARSAFEEVTNQEPRNAYAWASLAETYSRLKRSEAAESAAGKAEKFGSENPAIDHALAIYYTREGKFGHAAELEQKFADSERADPDAQARVASLFLDAGKTAEALTSAQKAVDKHPSPATENLLGRILIASGNAGDGEIHLRIAWEGAKTDSTFAFDYSQALLRQQGFEKAAEVLSAALQAHPDDAQLVLALGVARYGERRFDDAMNAFLKVIRIDPQVEQPYVFLGKMLDQAGEHLADITAACEKWAALNPQNATALMVLAKARLAADPKDSTAEGLLHKAIDLDGRLWEAHYELGVLLEAKRDWPRAAAELKRSAELDGKQAMPHYHLARVYDRLGDAEKAKSERNLHETLTGAK
jgi:tetratricopeptide (TPR) repeat protein